MGECLLCGGTGTCDECGGTGEQISGAVVYRCDVCNGYKICVECGGTGTVEEDDWNEDYGY